ncbi:phage portal protein [Zhihengliuella sp.]|uniref:phage portal protein n=1 Tax=Zhihengliuella sp. TaxID=1954483 RepID=UPI002810AF2B|nr:phage portal protein [Zhihengliuella sp.]
MDVAQAREYLRTGEQELSDQQKRWDRVENYINGEQDLPYAPEGVNAEYQQLREMSIANWMAIAVFAPTQRLQVDGFRTGRDPEADKTAWQEIWQPNKLDSRQGIVFRDMYAHGRGVMSVTKDPARPDRPKIRPENARRVWIGSSPEDPFTHTWAVKIVTVAERRQTSLALPSGVTLGTKTKHAYVYDDTSWAHFVATDNGFGGSWELEGQGDHGLGALPFVAFDYNTDSNGKPRSAVEALMPQQDAINTIRFNTLLAMQFSAYRQRIITAYDPVVRDGKGNAMVKVDDDGKPILDGNGLQIPLTRSPGRFGVDRALVFPGEATKVYDLPESNLDNYIKVLQEFLTDFFATGQIPPQYMLSRMANLSGDALAGAESTLQSLVKDLKRAAGESLEDVMRLANRARGENHEDNSSEVIWADTEPRSFAQIVDAIQKLITTGMSRKDAWAMLPGSTPPKVEEWVNNSDADRRADDEALHEMAGKLAGAEV